MMHSSFSGRDKNLLAGASSALPGVWHSAKPVCLAYYAVSVLVYFYSAIAAHAIDILTSDLCVFLVALDLSQVCFVFSFSVISRDGEIYT
jgi:hypothetical protein